MGRTKKIPIERIDIASSPKPRAEMNAIAVKDYAHHLLAGGRFPPVDLFHHRDGESYLVADGWHRIEATIQLAAFRRWSGLSREVEEPKIDALVHDGSPRDCTLFAVGANAEHGLRRTNADKRRAVELLLADEQWVKRSDSWIAEKCHVSNHLVAEVRRDLENSKSASASTRRRVGKDGREIDTGRIGRKPPDKLSWSAEQNKPVCGEDVRAVAQPLGEALSDALEDTTHLQVFVAAGDEHRTFVQAVERLRPELDATALVVPIRNEKDRKRCGVDSLPTIRLCRGEEILRERTGTLPSSVLRSTIKEWVGAQADTAPARSSEFTPSAKGPCEHVTAMIRDDIAHVVQEKPALRVHNGKGGHFERDLNFCPTCGAAVTMKQSTGDMGAEAPAPVRA